MCLYCFPKEQTMEEKIIEKKSVFKSKTGAEISEKMRAYFKKYTIPEMKAAESLIPKVDLYTEATKIFDGNLPLFNH